MIFPSGIDLADLRDGNDWLSEKLDAAAWDAELVELAALKLLESVTEESRP